jgi:hypothetical protein
VPAAREFFSTARELCISVRLNVAEQRVRAINTAERV